MAEFCLDCWKALNEMENPEERYILSSEYELCEGCGEYKPVIVRIKRPSPLGKLLKKLWQKP